MICTHGFLWILRVTYLYLKLCNVNILHFFLRYVYQLTLTSLQNSVLVGRISILSCHFVLETAHGIVMGHPDSRFCKFQQFSACPETIGIQTDREIQNPIQVYEHKITAYALNPFAT